MVITTIVLTRFVWLRQSCTGEAKPLGPRKRPLEPPERRLEVPATLASPCKDSGSDPAVARTKPPLPRPGGMLWRKPHWKRVKLKRLTCWRRLHDAAKSFAWTEHVTDGWHSRNMRFWAKEAATLDGMTGGGVSDLDLAFNQKFLRRLCRARGNAKGRFARALDVGAGIGRLAQHLLRPVCDAVDLLEPVDKHLETAKKTLKPWPGEFYCCTLQDFGSMGTGRDIYDLVWCQWVLMYITDSDVVAFLQRLATASLAPAGTVVVKENVAQERVGSYFDDEEGELWRGEAQGGDASRPSQPMSVLRTPQHYVKLFKESGFEVVMRRRQFFSEDEMPMMLFTLAVPNRSEQVHRAAVAARSLRASWEKQAMFDWRVNGYGSKPRTDVGRALRTLAGAGPPDGSHLGRGKVGDDVLGALKELGVRAPWGFGCRWCPLSLQASAILLGIPQVVPIPSRHGMTSKRKRKRNSSSSPSSSSRARVKVVAEESQLVREKVDGYVIGQPDPEQNEQSVSRTATNIRVGAPIRSEKRMNFVWVVKAGAQKGQSKYSLDPESAYIDPRDKQRVTRDKICCDICGNLLRRPYRVRCYRRRTPYDPPETEVDRKMEPDIYLVGHRCMKGLLGIPGQKCAPRTTRLRLDIRKTLLNGTIFQMEDNKEGEEQNSKEFKETEIVQALQTELAKVISECAGPEAAWRQLPKDTVAPREVGVRSGAGCRAFEERPYNEEEDVTEDEGAAVIKLPPKKKRNVPRGPKPKATVVTAEPEPEEEEEEEQGLLPEPAKPSRFMDQHKTMLPLVAQKLSQVEAPHKLYSKVLPGFSRPPFLIVIPTYGRPDRLVRETLAFLRRQKIPQNLIEIWLAPGHAPGQKLSERERYEKALAPEWPDVHIRTGVKGVMQQRWRIGLAHPEGMHLVSFDDDIPEVFEKIKPGTSSDTMQPLEAGSLEAIIHHARDLMHQEGCYIWGLAPSANPMNLVVNRISRRNGMVNGFAYGYLNRHDECFQSLYCSPTEDVERSCRFYEKDGVLLRYLMYAARTKFKAPDGISLLYENARARKLDEEAAIVKISDEFPHLLQVRTGERRRKSEEAMNFTFISLGQGPLLPNGVTTKAWAAGISGQPPIVASKEAEALSEVKVQEVKDPKLKAKLTKQAQDEKELLDKCVQMQEYLLEQQEAAEDALQSGKAPKEVTQSVQKLLENVINGANVDKVIFSKRKAPKPVPPQVEVPRAQVTSQDNGVSEVTKVTEVIRPPIPPGTVAGAAPSAAAATTVAGVRQDEVVGAVTPQHLLLATSLAKVQALQQFQSHNWNWGRNDFSRDEWWMTQAPVTPPELRQSQVLSVDLSDNEDVISASPGHTPPLQGLLRPPESDDEDVEIVAVNGENPGGSTVRRLVPPEVPRLVPPEVQGESKEPSLHPEPPTEFSDLEDDDLVRRLQDTVRDNLTDAG
eukprot:s1738_g4.t1